MPLLFSYGTLRDVEVQMSLFGRRLACREDELVGFRQEWIEVADPAFAELSGSASHSILKPSSDSRVPGTVLEVTESELEIADGYEPAEYRRVLAPLASGGETWVFVDGSDTSFDC